MSFAANLTIGRCHYCVIVISSNDCQRDMSDKIKVSLVLIEASELAISMNWPVACPKVTDTLVASSCCDDSLKRFAVIPLDAFTGFLM